MLPNVSRPVFTVIMVLALGVVAEAAGQKVAASKPSNQQQQQQQQLQQQLRQFQQQQQQQMQLIQRAQQQQAQAARTQAQRTAQIARQQARNNRNQPRPVLKNVVAEYELTLADEAIARTMATPAATDIDEKGRPRKLDAEERKKLKGDTAEERKLIGYKAGVEDLQVGDEVIVTLSRYVPKKKPASPGEKDAEKTRDSEKSKDKDADKAKDKDAREKEADKDVEKAKEKDGEAREKGKAKDSDKEEKKETDENDDAQKLAKLKDWKPYSKLYGTIVEVDISGSRRVTIAIQNQQLQMQAPNNNRNGQPNNQANPKPTQTSIDPSTLQGTFVIVVKRNETPVGGTAKK